MQFAHEYSTRDSLGILDGVIITVKRVAIKNYIYDATAINFPIKGKLLLALCLLHLHLNLIRSKINICFHS